MGTENLYFPRPITPSKQQSQPQTILADSLTPTVRCLITLPLKSAEIEFSAAERYKTGRGTP